MVSGASSSSCLDTSDLVCLCEVTTTAHACGASRGAHLAENISPHVFSLSPTLRDHGMFPCHACPFPPCAAVDRSRILAPGFPQQHGLGARSHRGPPRGSRLATSALRQRGWDREHVTRTWCREEKT